MPDAGSRSRVSNDSNMCHRGCDFLEQFRPFRTHLVVEDCEPGDVAARLRQTINKATADGIANIRKYDWHAPGRLLQCGEGWSGNGKDDVRRQCHQFCCRFLQVAA